MWCCIVFCNISQFLTSLLYTRCIFWDDLIWMLIVYIEQGIKLLAIYHMLCCQFSSTRVAAQALVLDSSRNRWRYANFVFCGNKLKNNKSFWLMLCGFTNCVISNSAQSTGYAPCFWRFHNKNLEDQLHFGWELYTIASADSFYDEINCDEQYMEIRWEKFEE